MNDILKILSLLDDAPATLLAKFGEILRVAQKFPRGDKVTNADYVAFVEFAQPLLCSLTPEEFAFLKAVAGRF
jgi:hypothetical protein